MLMRIEYFVSDGFIRRMNCREIVIIRLCDCIMKRTPDKLAMHHMWDLVTNNNSHPQSLLNEILKRVVLGTRMLNNTEYARLGAVFALFVLT